MKALEEARAFLMTKQKKLLPNREQFAVVYRYLREQKGWNYGLDVLYFSFRAKDTFRCSVLNFSM